MTKNLIIGALSLALVVSLLLHLTRPERVGPPPVAEVAPPPLQPPPPPPPGPVLPVQPEPLEEPEPVRDPRLQAFDDLFEAAGDDPGLSGAAIGFCVMDSSGEVLYEKNGNIAHLPASALKTLTTATALEVLGPDFRFETRLGVSAPDDKGIARGDLILIGGGDPTLDLTDYQSWIEGLKEAGLATVPGRVIGDGRHFSGSIFADFWNWGDIGNGYGSPVSGLNLEQNRFTAILSPGEAEGEPTRLDAVLPDVPGVTWNNEVLTGAPNSGDGVVIHGGERTPLMHLRGTVPPGGEMTVKGAVPDPEQFAAHHLREALVAAGIRVVGEAVGVGTLTLNEQPVPAMDEELLVHRSPTLIEIIAGIHETSDNHETECLYRTLALETGMPADEAVRSHWKARGLDLASFRMVDGSGLARADFITPHALAKLQLLASDGPHGAAYVASLLSAFDGALRYKAGAMSAVRSLTGLVETNSGEVFTFAYLVNHYRDVSSVERLQGQLLMAMMNWHDNPVLESGDAPSPETE